VVDVETTGLYHSDRVVEIGVVTLDEHGAIVDRFETLVNPLRDVGPVWVHGITASMVADAPTFDEIAGEVASRLDGAVVCAHNLPFDARMLHHEFDRCSIDPYWGRGLDTLRVTGAKLGVACAEAGLTLENAHSALADAEATSRLLVTYARAFALEPHPARVRPFTVRPVLCRTRVGHPVVIEPPPFVAALAANTHAEPDVAPYEQLLDLAIADLRLTPDERTELDAMAAELGLSTADRERAHRDFISQMIDAAVADHVVTADEYDQLCRAAALLNVDLNFVDRRTDGLRSSTSTLTLSPGLTVCFTGAATDSTGHDLPRTELEARATAAGLMPVRNVTASKCGLLVAADPNTRSGKAANARKHGIPIASVADFLAALDGHEPLPVSQLASPGIALVCSHCGDSWLANRRQANPTCASCKASQRIAPTPTVAAPAATTPAATNPDLAAPTSLGGGATQESTLETLVCSSCGQSWKRHRVRGRKPQCCEQCR